MSSFARTARRLVIELLVLALLVGLPIQFPDSGSAWGYLLSHPTFLLHTVIGVVVLVESVLLLRRALVARGPELGIAGGGLGCVALAFGAGAVYVTGGEQGGALTLMTLGWVGAMALYVTGWVRGRRAARRRGPVDQPPSPSPSVR